MTDFFNLLIDAAWLQRQFDAHPRDMWAFTALVFAIGIAIGFGVGYGRGSRKRAPGYFERRRMERERAERELREREEREDAERREREEAERRERERVAAEVAAIRSLPPQQLKFLKRVYDAGMTDYNAEYQPMLSLARDGFVTIESKGFDSAYVSVEVAPRVRAFVSEHYDELFAE